jgi:threonine/homoserine/homoserine lactone efflux protein
MDVILKGIALGLFLSISVGPIVFAIIKTSLHYGRRAGYFFVAGVSLSDISIVLVANLAAELLNGILKYETALAIGGASFLLIIGFYTLFFKKDPSPDKGLTEVKFTPEELAHIKADPEHVHLWPHDLAKIFFQGFLMNILNPGPIILWIGYSTSFAYLPFYDRILLFATTLVIVLLTDIFKVRLADKMRKKLLTPKRLHLLNRITAFIFIGFGVAIIGGLVISKYW